MNMKLYHGTSSRYLESIRAEGIKPRGQTGINNWKHTVGSNKNAVYLTDAYVLHFAGAAVEDSTAELLLVLEVEVPEYRLQADEDAVEQVMRGHDGKEDWDMKRRTIYYRHRAHQYAAAATLKILGTCGHRGTILPDAITRSILLDEGRWHRLLLEAGIDPVISILNYRYLGEEYRQSVRWLFGDELVLARAPHIKHDFNVYSGLPPQSVSQPGE